MATPKPRLTAVERKKIRELIQRGREYVKNCRLHGYSRIARLLDDLADVAEKYLEVMKHGQPE